MTEVGCFPLPDAIYVETSGRARFNLLVLISPATRDRVEPVRKGQEVPAFPFLLGFEMRKHSDFRLEKYFVKHLLKVVYIKLL